MAGPIIDLSKKNRFNWGNVAEETFKLLKEVLITALILVYPDFSVLFVVEMDACNVGVRAVLAQLKHLVAYYRKKLSSVC